jgi:hypothetical protein
VATGGVDGVEVAQRSAWGVCGGGDGRTGAAFDVVV